MCIYIYMDAYVCLHTTKHTYVRKTCDERLSVCREREKEAECVDREGSSRRTCVLILCPLATVCVPKVVWALTKTSEEIIKK